MQLILNSSSLGQNAGFRCFIWCYLKQAFEQRVELLMIWFIMMLMWRNGSTIQTKSGLSEFWQNLHTVWPQCGKVFNYRYPGTNQHEITTRHNNMTFPYIVTFSRWYLKIIVFFFNLHQAEDVSQSQNGHQDLPPIDGMLSNGLIDLSSDGPSYRTSSHLAHVHVLYSLSLTYCWLKK